MYNLLLDFVLYIFIKHYIQSIINNIMFDPFDLTIRFIFILHQMLRASICCYKIDKKIFYNLFVEYYITKGHWLRIASITINKIQLVINCNRFHKNMNCDFYCKWNIFIRIHLIDHCNMLHFEITQHIIKNYDKSNFSVSMW